MPKAALQAYEHAIAADPALLDAHINLGSLLHEAGRLAEAERVYREAIESMRQRPRGCCTTSACCSMTWTASRKRWKRTRRRCAAIPTSPIATTTWRCCTRSSRSRRKRSGTWRSIAG